MEAIPLAFAIPAIYCYFNARWRIPVDWERLSTLAKTIYQARKRMARDRINLFYVLEEHATNTEVADKIFLVFEDKTFTFKQVYETTLKYAGWLRDTHKITAKEIVAINFMNGPEFLFITLALWSLGATPALINYHLTGEPLIHSVKSSTARLLIVEGDLQTKTLLPKVREAFSSPVFRQNAFPIDVVILDQGLRSSIEHFPPFRAPDNARSVKEGKEMAVLISTSGTTGLPKQGVVPWFRLAGGGYFSGLWQGLQSVTSKQPDRVYTSMPLYHSSAFMFGFGTCLMHAVTFALGRQFSLSKFWPEVRKHNVTVIQYVGETLRYLANAPVQPNEKTSHKVRMAFGNGLRPDVWKKFKARFGVETIAEFYGATEGVGASWNMNRNDFSDGAIGQTGLISELLANRSQAIVQVDWETESPWRDPQTGFCQRLPRGEAGELLFRVDATDIEATFQGYHDNQKASDAKILKDVFEAGDAYFRTGDIIKWDQEGRLWFSDRIGDTFRWKSENVSTAEVAEVMGYHPAVEEANVYGVKVPGYEGRAGCAAVVLKSEALVRGVNGVEMNPAVLQSLAAHATTNLPRFSVPVFLRVVEEMDTTGNNKQRKHGLRSEGIDVDMIARRGCHDRLYWLPPGATSYESFTTQDLKSLTVGQARL